MIIDLLPILMQQQPDSNGDVYRLAWEYFECIGYDRALYDELVRQKKVDSEMETRTRSYGQVWEAMTRMNESSTKDKVP